MKRSVCLLLMLILALSALPFGVAAEEDGITDLKIYGVNTECRTGQLVLYTESGKPTGTDEGCTEVLIGKDGLITSIGG